MKQIWIIFLISTISFSLDAENLWIEAESFIEKGGWVIDNQSMNQMGSPYLLAHGLGIPVKDAMTTIQIQKSGTYRVWVRTRDWVKTWDKTGSPGRFELKLNGQSLPVQFGTEKAEWHWQDGGVISLTEGKSVLALHDLTGFEGRCDAIFLTTDLKFSPPESFDTLTIFRRKMLNLPDKPEFKGHYDLVVVGGGIAGCCAAISAARLGCSVALIQNRPVLGGNNSSEVRVGLSGLISQQPYPNLGNLLDELGGVGFWNNWEAEQDSTTVRSQQIKNILKKHPEKLTHNAGPASNYEDEKKFKLICSHKNINLFLNTQVINVKKEGSVIKAVIGKDIQTGKEYLFEGSLFSDCTGDGDVGFLAGADYKMGREGKAETGEPRAPEKPDQLVMGTSVQWYTEESAKEILFPKCPWAVKFNEQTYIPITRGDWDWETGLNKNQITEIEYIRDYALRAVYGNWDYLKNNSKEKSKYANKKLAWVAYIGGKRESRRLLGDVILKEQDIINNVQYDDASFTTTWGVDLHYPKPIPGMKEEAFLTFCDVEEIKPYAVPYRCLYSRNIDNLFMAGRNISVTHVALGTVRVMRTGGMMGEVVGMAASLCKKYHTTPRGIYKNHLSELKILMQKGIGKKGFKEPEYIHHTPKNPYLIPFPDSVSIQKEETDFLIDSLKTVYFPSKWQKIGQQFITDLQKKATISVQEVDKEAVLTVKENKSIQNEAYILKIENKKIVIEVHDKQGLNYALSTLLQLIIVNCKRDLPELTITDHPRFSYRGIMLDCSRHFWEISELKKTIDQMAFFKLNTLHLHLTDNQGWRLAMDKYPQLAEKGSYYYDHPELSGKYYSKNNLKDLVDYASLRGISIIPEVDLPGHCIALLAGLPELSCQGGTFETYPEEREAKKRKRVAEHMICVGNPQSLAFVEDVVDVLIDIFPSPYIHLGGDEVGTNIWKQCPKCMALYRQKGMKDIHEIQDYFTKEVSRIVRSKGRTMIGWDEINSRNAASTDDMLTIWQNDGKEQQKKALERNIAVIMCPKDPCYFDFGYARNPTRKVYEWEPIDKTIPQELHSLVKGGQACLWTEFVTTQTEVEKMYYPRLCALAEVLWIKPEKKDWTDFYSRLTHFQSMFDLLDIHNYKGEKVEDNWFNAVKEQPKLIQPARIETNITAIKYYNPEYAFDGKEDTFFSSSYAVGKGDYFTVILNEAQTIKGIEVICDDSKEFLSHADLLISTDNINFVKVGEFNKHGQASVSFAGKSIKAIKIDVKSKHFNRLTIREIHLLL